MNEHQSFHRVASLVFGQPLLATIEAAETVGAYLRARMEGLDVQANRFVGDQQFDEQTGRWKGFRKEGSVAVVSILGELVNRGAWMGASSGLTSYEGIVEQVRQAAADPSVTAVLLDINSPGGEAWGMVDAARQIRASVKGKPLIALANAAMASAAYGLGAVADRVFVNEAGLAGSIGVVMVHYDESARLEKNGVKATVIATGPKKAAGYSAVPLSDEHRALLEARAATVMAGFVKLITDHRPQLSSEAIYALEGDVLIGAEAVKAGLADEIGTFQSVLKTLSSTRAAGRNNSHKGASMSETNGAPAAETNAGITQVQLDQTVAAAVAQANAAADARLTAERSRMAGLDKLLGEFGGNQKAAAIVAAAKSDGSSAEATALKLIEAGAHKQAAVLGALQQDDATATAGTPAAAGSGNVQEPATKEGFEAQWKADAKLQAEHPRMQNYVALKTHERKLKDRAAA